MNGHPYGREEKKSCRKRAHTFIYDTHWYHLLYVFSIALQKNTVNAFFQRIVGGTKHILKQSALLIRMMISHSFTPRSAYPARIIALSDQMPDLLTFRLIIDVLVPCGSDRSISSQQVTTLHYLIPLRSAICSLHVPTIPNARA